MAHLIDKAAVVVEIEKRMQKLLPMVGFATTPKGASLQSAREELKHILSFLDTLEVKEVEDTEPLKVRGYLVRDKDDFTAIHAKKPHRGKTEWVNDGNDACLMIINDARLVPDIEFEDEPVEVEVTLKRLNNGE